jgi:hypothetical protein
MPHKFFYSWQSERPASVCRRFIRTGLDSVSTTLNQSGVDERIEIDSDTQGIPGTPEIFSTILSKIDDAAIFIADLTICAEAPEKRGARLYPNSNVMFEYGYALKAKTRGRLICVMNTFYGGDDPTQLPFDLRHTRAPIRFSLSPTAKTAEKKRTFEKLCDDLLAAARLILDNLTDEVQPVSKIEFLRPHFESEQEVTPEGDFSGQIDPTFFGDRSSFIFLRGMPSKPMTLSPAQIKRFERGSAGLNISYGSNAGSSGTNKWGRISYAIEESSGKRMTCDYVQYFRSGELEIVNGSYFHVIRGRSIHLDMVIEIISHMLEIMKDWMERTSSLNSYIEVGVIGVGKLRITNRNFDNGPLLHQDKVSVHKNVSTDSVRLVADEVRSALLAEAGA